MQLAQPAWLLLLPLLALAFFKLHRPPQAQTPSTQLVHSDLSGLPEEAAQALGTQRLPLWLTFAASCLLVVGMTQPQWLGPAIPDKPLGRDIMLLVDTSTSMSIDDFEWNKQRVTRLEVLKGVARQFVAARSGDRFGLIVFGSQAATLSPPTFDQDLMQAQLSRVQVGIAGEATAIGDAIGLALKQIKTEGRLKPALILFSDGDSTAGEMKPSEALVAAQALDAKIYTVQIGTDLFASPDRPKQLNPEPSLQQIAEATKAKFFVAGDTKALQNIIREIDRLEPSISRPATRRQIVEWYWLALAVGALLLIAAQLLSQRETAT